MSEASSWKAGAIAQLEPKPEGPVVPKSGQRNILITSALPYVNNVPHLGNVIGSVLSADVYARYCRLRGYNTLYICGTDEYGTASEVKAIEEGLTPMEVCDKYHEIHKSVYRWFNIEFDFFGRTSSSEHIETCHEIFERLNHKKFLFTEFVDQWLCGRCDFYLADRFVAGVCPLCGYEDARGDQCDGCGHLINASELGQPRCQLCGSSPELRSSIHYFLDLPKVEPVVRAWAGGAAAAWSPNARAIAEAWLQEGLKARCITRDLKWGVPVPVPEYHNKVLYVWFDAPIGYISMTKQLTERWREWWLPRPGTPVELVQFMAKDNVPFHSIIFPACLLATRRSYSIVDRIFATEHLTYEGKKFSKSRGVGVFGGDVATTDIPPDVWRFYLLFIRPETQDSNFSWRDLASKNNNELLNNLGNFVFRTLKFVEMSFSSVIPSAWVTEAETRLIQAVNGALTFYHGNMERGRLRESLKNILAVCRVGNQYLQTEQPWALIKRQEMEHERAAQVIGMACNLVCLLSLLIQPFLPVTASEISRQLGMASYNLRLTDDFTPLLPPGLKVNNPKPLFRRIEEVEIVKLIQRFSGGSGEHSSPTQ